MKELYTLAGGGAVVWMLLFPLAEARPLRKLIGQAVVLLIGGAIWWQTR